MRTNWQKLGAVGLALALGLGAATTAMADQHHEHDLGPAYNVNTLNPGHLWVAVGAAQGGIVSSGGRFHDSGANGFSGPYNGNWAMDIEGEASITFSVASAGQGTGPLGYPLIDVNHGITVRGRLALQSGPGEDNRCKFQRWDVLATWTPIGQSERTDNIGWVTYAHVNFSYSSIGTIVDNGAVLGSVVHVDRYNAIPCNSGSHVHMEFSSNGNDGAAYEWHGIGPDWYEDHEHWWSDAVTCPESYQYRGANNACAPRDSVDTGATVGLLGGDRVDPRITMWTNPCYTRRPPRPPQHQSASVSETSVTVFFSDNSCDETSLELTRQGPGGWPPLTPALPGDKGMYTRSVTDFGRDPGTYYAYWARANNAYGTTWAGSYITAVTLGAPIAPQAVAGWSFSPTSAHIEWSDRSQPGDPTGGEAGFMVTRFNGSQWVPIASLGANVTFFNDSGLSPGTAYAYWIYAYRGTSSEGHNPNGPDPQEAWAPGYVSVDTLPSPADANAPMVVAAFASQSSATLVINQFLGADILRYNPLTSGWDPAGSIPYGQNVFTDYNRKPGAYYGYWVVSNNGYTSLRPTTVITAKANAPRSIWAAGYTAAAIALGWLDLSNDEAGFNLYRQYLAPGGYWELVEPAMPNVTGFVNTGLGAGTTRAYWLAGRSETPAGVEVTWAPAYIAATTFPP